MSQTYTRGILLWVDDRFDGERDQSKTKWKDLFGNRKDRLYRLMDLSLEVVCTRSDAIAAIKRTADSRAAGTFVQSIVDLTIPMTDIADPTRIEHGIAVGMELHNRGLPFVFLSANAHAAEALGEVGLASVPYHPKEPTTGAWRLPEGLAEHVLGEFRRNISWVSLADAVDSMDPQSDIVKTRDRAPVAFEYFPFFGPYADFVERSETKDRVDMHGAFVLRCTVDHCDQFVQQALCVMLYERLVRQPKAIRIRYGKANDEGYLGQWRSPAVANDSDAVSAIRVSPKNTTAEELGQLAHAARGQAGTTIFIVPNDESADPYAELFRQFGIPAVDEIPQARLGDAAARKELIRRTCQLVFQRWTLPTDEGKPEAEKSEADTSEHGKPEDGKAGDGKSEDGKQMPLPREYLAHPELLINPIDWVALQEEKLVAEALSDPYEITNELDKATREISEHQLKKFRNKVSNGLPLPYKLLLKVGRKTLERSEYEKELPAWIERALDIWLHESWHFPYGLGKQFAEMEHGGSHVESSEEAFRPKNCDDWEDSCYDVLAGMLDEYPIPKDKTDRQTDLDRVNGFVEALGGREFLKKPEKRTSPVNWEALESFRWPHHRYPMPAAINRRLKQAGRYLWIQPEGLDTALTLPWGRQHYRFLSDIVEHYSSVLSWAEKVAPKLPLGWKSSVEFLVEIIRKHQVAKMWRKKKQGETREETKDREADRQKIWDALHGLRLNGAPIMLIADYALRGKPLTETEGRRSAEEILKNAHGTGVILGPLRSSEAARLNGCLLNRWLPAEVQRYRDLVHLVRCSCELLRAGTSQMDERAKPLITELDESLATLLTSLGDVGTGAGGADISSVLSDAFMFMRTAKPGMTDPLKGWAVDGNNPVPPELIKACPYAVLHSLFKTKGDYLWQMVEVLTVLGHLSYHYRYFDGYHLLAVLNDLRVRHKTKPPTPEQVGVAEVEIVLDLFVAALKGLIAQLAWCLEIAGHPQRAEAIAPPNVWVQRPKGVKRPGRKALARVLRVENRPNGYAVGTLGSPDGGLHDQIVYHEGGEAISIGNIRTSGK